MAYEPMFYVWCFSPRSGEVSFTHALEGHALDNRTLGTLANEANDQNAMTGYAAKIERGWRVTDNDGKPLTDPFVKRQVVRALGSGHPDQEVSEHDNNPYPVDWDRYQYGKPMSPIQTDSV